MTNTASEQSVSPFVATVPFGTQYLTIPEASRRLAEAIHPKVEGELPLAEALNHQWIDGVHFSEASQTTIQNAVLRRDSTSVYHEAGLQTAVREGKITPLSPMTYGPKAISMHGNSAWQSEVNRCLIRVSDIAAYAKNYNIKVIIAEQSGSTGLSQTPGNVSSQTPRERQINDTEQRRQVWIAEADRLKKQNPRLSTSDISKVIAKQSENTARPVSPKTVRNNIAGKY